MNKHSIVEIVSGTPRRFPPETTVSDLLTVTVEFDARVHIARVRFAGIYFTSQRSVYYFYIIYVIIYVINRQRGQQASQLIAGRRLLLVPHAPRPGSTIVTVRERAS